MQKFYKRFRFKKRSTVFLSIGFFLIGCILLVFTGPTQLICTRTTENINCSVNGLSVFGLVQTVEISSVVVKSVRLDTQTTMDRLVASDGTSSEIVVSSYGVQLVGNSTLIFGDYSSNQGLQQSKVDRINLFLNDKLQSNFTIQSKDYQFNMLGVLIMIVAGFFTLNSLFQ